METINDFDQLIAELNRSKGHEDSYLSTLKRVDIPKETYNSFLAFNEDNYVRNCIYKNNDYVTYNCNENIDGNIGFMIVGRSGNIRYFRNKK